jgi:hypothetical protein
MVSAERMYETQILSESTRKYPLPPLWIESWFLGCPALSLVATPTDLSSSRSRVIYPFLFCFQDLCALFSFLQIWLLVFGYINIVTCISFAREQLGKHVPAKKNSWPKIDKGLSVTRQRSVNTVHCEPQRDSDSRMNALPTASSNCKWQDISSCQRGLWPQVFIWEKKILAVESQGTRTRERLRWWGSAAYTKGRPVLSSERAPHKNKILTVKK